MKQGTVFLVGAGPGDPLLLTERGKQCLQEADVVVYDALVSASVLNFLFVQLSLQGKKVLRL